MWKTLKGYFISEEQELSNSKPAPLPGAMSEPAPSPTTPAPAASQNQPAAGVVSDEFIKVLMQAMEAVNQPGFDYLEFKRSLQRLKEMDMSEALRYQSAFAAAQSMGVTRQALLDSATHYLQELDREELKFNKALREHRGKRVDEREGQLKQYDQQIAQREATIKRLREEMKQLREKQGELKTELGKSARKIAKTGADFAATHRVIADSIDKDVANIKKYLS